MTDLHGDEDMGEIAVDSDFSECEEISDGRPLRQGHIFEWLKCDEPWKLLGVIVTADCDIVERKYVGVLSYVPVLDVRDYLSLFVFPNFIQRGLRPTGAELATLIRRYQAKNHPEFSVPLSSEAALAWAASVSADELASELQIDDGRDRAKFMELAQAYLELRSVSNAGNYDDMIGVLAKARIRAGGKEETFWKDIQNIVDNLPGDCFYLGRVSSAHKRMYVAYLRLVREVREPEIALLATDLEKPEVSAKRISRLTSPYVYRLTQQLGDVFASIGLPEDYERNRTGCTNTLRALRVPDAKEQDR
jgi:hypothetical protein